MTEYNGQTITYDRIGNPLTYRDGMTMTWKRGRQLTTLQTEENSIQYRYDSDSIRTSKIVNGVVHTYEYLNGLLMHETRGEQAYDYYYDANGQLYAVSYKLSETDTKKVYYFTHNWRGDIVGIYNGNGDLKATYSYDAWGNVTAIEDANGNAITSATHIANLNPFRYRGYYQDTETGLYYLMSRYYDPVTHRFVNADGYFQSGGDILDTNMNAYCRNNPINYFDPTGTECAIHKPGYVPNCEYCSPFYAEYKQNQKAKEKRNAPAEEHYSRNKLNVSEYDSVYQIMGRYEEQSGIANIFHFNVFGNQGGEAIYNKKYLSPNGGHIEIVICTPPNKEPYIVDETIDPLNMGTYNYASNEQFFISYFAEHFMVDMLPYFLYGNTSDDSFGLVKWYLQ